VVARRNGANTELYCNRLEARFCLGSPISVRYRARFVCDPSSTKDEGEALVVRGPERVTAASFAGNSRLQVAKCSVMWRTTKTAMRRPSTALSCNNQRLKTTTAERVRKHREQLKAAGMRPIQIWVPDTRRKGFAAKARRHSLRTREDPQEDILAWIERAADLRGWSEARGSRFYREITASRERR
jgi:hypothetical protein